MLQLNALITKNVSSHHYRLRMVPDLTCLKSANTTRMDTTDFGGTFETWPLETVGDFESRLRLMDELEIEV